MQLFLPPAATLPQNAIARVCGWRVSAPLRVSGQGPSSVQGGTLIKEGSHKQDHAGTQTDGQMIREGVMRPKPDQ